VQEYGRIDFIDHGIEIAFIPGCCLERVIVKGQELGIIFFKLRFGPGQYIIQFIIGIEIEIILGDCILKKCPGNIPFGGGCFFISQGTVFVLVRFLHIIVHPNLPGSVQIEKKRKKYNRCNDPFHPASFRIAMQTKLLLTDKRDFYYKNQPI
jgi:hypothetical protein